MSAVARLARRAARDEGGEGAVWFVLWLPVLIVVVSIIWDTGRALQTAVKASTTATQAARKGVDSVDPQALRVQDAVPPEAIDSACAWVIAAMPSGSCTGRVEGQTVYVHVAAMSPTSLAGVLGVSGIPVAGDAEATAVVGAAAPVGG